MEKKIIPTHNYELVSDLVSHLLINRFILIDRLAKIVCTLIILIGCSSINSILAQDSTKARNHVILIDASGSMKPHYQAGLREWLIAPLLSSGIFSNNDRVILRAFDKRGNKNFIKDDVQRRYYGKFDRDAILEKIPTANESNGRNTAIPEALDLGLADIESLNLSGDTFIWLITDNIQDVSGSGDDPIAPFYEHIYNDKNFKYIYFFPIVREGEQGALVMYALNYNRTDNNVPLANTISNLMDGVGKSINYRPVLFRPIRLSALELDRGSILFESDDGTTQPAELEDGRIVVTLSPGRTLNGRIKFKLRSKFREWKIEQASVSNAHVAIEASPSLDLSEGENLDWQLDPRTLDIGPQETSKKVYAIDLASGRALASITPSFIQSFFVDPEVRVNGLIRFEVENPQLRLAFFDDKDLADRIRRVKGLEQIEQFILPPNVASISRNLTLEIPIMVKVSQPPRPLWVLILMGVILLAAIVVVITMLNKRADFRLVGPEGEKILRFRAIGGVQLSIGEEMCGELVYRFGSFTIKTLPPYVTENGSRQQRIQNTATFIITNSDNNRTWSFSLEALNRAEDKDAVGGGDMFVS